MSHGVPRVHDSSDKSAQARAKELKQIEEYQGLVDQVDRAIKTNVLTHDTLLLTSKLLTWNPEYYTIWNHRRRVIERLLLDLQKQNHEPKQLQASTEEMLVSDMQFIMPLLIKFPKCYWIWNHRRWVLIQCSTRLSAVRAHSIWMDELGLVGKMLARDSRNFHGWGYRRFVITELENIQQDEHENHIDESKDLSRGNSAEQTSLTEREYEYTTKMVKQNLSNFSAWHNRSKLIPRLLEERQADIEARRALFNDELSLIDSAVFTDPYDQSLWFYHEFLMGELSSTETTSFTKFSERERREYLKQEIESIAELLEDTTDCKLVYQHLLLYTDKYLEMEAGELTITMEEMKSWLSRLLELDPLRQGRWKDLAIKLDPE